MPMKTSWTRSAGIKRSFAQAAATCYNQDYIFRWPQPSILLGIKRYVSSHLCSTHSLSDFHMCLVAQFVKNTACAGPGPSTMDGLPCVTSVLQGPNFRHPLEGANCSNFMRWNRLPLKPRPIFSWTRNFRPIFQLIRTLSQVGMLRRHRALRIRLNWFTEYVPLRCWLQYLTTEHCHFLYALAYNCL